MRIASRVVVPTGYDEADRLLIDARGPSALNAVIHVVVEDP